MSQADPQTDKNLVPEMDDLAVTDEQLGRIVRQYRGLVRPPQVVTVRPGWFDKTVVLLGFCLVIVVVALTIAVVGAVNTTLGNRQKGDDIKHVLCDKQRIPELVNADERTKQICGID